MRDLSRGVDAFEFSRVCTEDRNCTRDEEEQPMKDSCHRVQLFMRENLNHRVTETGDRRPETGDRRPETGDRRPETGETCLKWACDGIF